MQMRYIESKLCPAYVCVCEKVLLSHNEIYIKL